MHSRVSRAPIAGPERRSAFAAILVPLLLGCPARPVAVHPHPAGAAGGPTTEGERRTWLMLEDRCLVEQGGPCSWSDELAAGARALAALLAREGEDVLRREAVVRAELQRAGIGHPNAMAAALFHSADAPSDQDLESFVAGIDWPFAARAFGVAEGPGGAAVVPGSGAPASGMVVVVGAEPLVELDPLPRWLPQSATLTFFGHVLFGAESLDVLLADPAGAVRQGPVALDDERGFDGAVLVGPDPGRWIFELVAQDEVLGPRVVYLMPIELSLDPPGDAGAPPALGPETTEPAAAEAVMAEKVVAFREQNGLGGLVRDPDLDRVARDQADDMAANGFFGHVSPTRGDLERRLRDARIVLPRAAENLAVGPSAEAAFASLLESPAHRANFLDPDFTRFGIAASPRGDSLLFAVELAAER